ncbi:MAG: large repetitive protein, partial [Frankiaceae bacterium]|nr:large repetitive protein [Frankiaceae bacterium]
ADPDTGSLNWVEDCHGDTYSSYATGGAVYVVGHSHECSTVPNGFSQTDPWTFYRGTAFTAAAAGTLGKTPYSSYKNWAGTPAPAQLHWYPTLTVGTVTGQNQAAWNITGNGRYIVLAGEFPKVNGVAQQGLVRMALPSTVASKTTPVNAGNAFTPVFSQPSAGTVKVSWQANYDRDNEQLTYKLVRNGNTAAPIYTTTLASKPWSRAAMSFTDTGLVPGQTYTYRIYAVDPHGNSAPGTALSVTVGSDTPYANAVQADGANRYWRMAEPAGSNIAFDSIAGGDGYGNQGVTAGGAGALLSETTGRSYAFNGTSGAVSARDAVTGPQTFTVESWFKSTSAKGGKIVGFGNNATGPSSSYDRHVYLDKAGHLVFGVTANGNPRTVASAGTYNDGNWHQVTATLGNGGMHLFVDGAEVAANRSFRSAGNYSGYWKIGGDNLAGWTNKPSSNFLAGSIDEVAVYPTELTPSQVTAHYRASGR